jgi:hypothetical protein
VTDRVAIWQAVRDVFRGMAYAGHRRQLRGQAADLHDLFLLLCYMDVMGLPNPAALYLLDVYPFVVEEFHVWHRRMGMDRSPLATFSCC